MQGLIILLFILIKLKGCRVNKMSNLLCAEFYHDEFEYLMYGTKPLDTDGPNREELHACYRYESGVELLFPDLPAC